MTARQAEAKQFLDAYRDEQARDKANDDSGLQTKIAKVFGSTGEPLTGDPVQHTQQRRFGGFGS